jgi:tetratricopeptide (TPR) repeat protein
MIQQRSRLPAIMMLLALLAFGVGMGFARKGSGSSALDSQIAQLKTEVSKPDAKPEVWLKYGQALQSVKRYSDAAVAYDQVLKVDPYQRDARLQCAICRSILGDHDVFGKFMEDTVAVDPKLAKAIFERPDMAGFLSEPRFEKLNQAAIAGSMD